VYVASAGSFDSNSSSFKFNDTLTYALVYHFFGLLWIRSFILAVGDLVIAGAVGDWYMRGDAGRKSGMGFAVTRSVFRTFRYHLGTAAFGSLLIAIIEFIRAVFNYYTLQMKKLEEKHEWVKYARCCVNCCLWCIERFLKFASKNAYIQTACFSKKFCPACVSALGVLSRNILRLIAIQGLSGIFILLGRLFVAVSTGFICAIILQGGDLQSVSGADPATTTICFIIGFAVASAFMSIYDMVIDTIFQCFCVDCESGDGPSRAPEDLRHFMESKKQDAPPEEKGAQA